MKSLLYKSREKHSRIKTWQTNGKGDKNDKQRSI